MILVPFVCRGRRKKSYSLARSLLHLPGSADIVLYYGVSILTREDPAPLRSRAIRRLVLFLHAFATCITVQQEILNVRDMVALYVFFVTCVAEFCTMGP